MIRNHITIVPHFPYSSDLAPCNFFCFQNSSLYSATAAAAVVVVINAQALGGIPFAF